MHELLGKGNHKLSSKQAIWTLPSGITCIGAGECAKWCYSRKAERSYPSVNKSRAHKLEQSQRADFVDLMVNAVVRSKRQVVRVHQDGDFYSQLYLDNWKEIARRLPDVTFYAFTKSFGLLDFWTDLPENFVILQSFGSRYDDRIDWGRNTARVIEDAKEKKLVEYLCPYHKEDFTKCGEYCSYCYSGRGVRHVTFLKH